jgi:hypothetical protein
MRMEEAMTEKKALADELGKWLRENDLAYPTGYVELSDSTKYYEVGFSRPQTLNGYIRVHGPEFLLVRCEGPDVKGKHFAVYDSKENLMRFLRAIKDRQVMDALRVPIKSNVVAPA